MEIRIDIDAEKQKAATQDERQEFLTALFSVASQATADYGARVDFSDAHHWVITFPDEYELQVSALFAAQRRGYAASRNGDVMEILYELVTALTRIAIAIVAGVLFIKFAAWAINRVTR